MYKIKNRILLSTLTITILISFILIEIPLHTNVINSFIGNIYFYSIFDKIKFFLPITLLLSIISDYLSFLLGTEGCIILTRFKNRKNFSVCMLKRLYFTVFLFWFINILLSILISYCFNIRVVLDFNIIASFIIGYLLYSMIASIQVLLSLFLDSNKAFVIITMVSIMSTLVTNNFVKYLFVIPIGMGLIESNLSTLMLRILLMLSIIVLAWKIIYKKIERLDIG